MSLTPAVGLNNAIITENSDPQSNEDLASPKKSSFSMGRLLNYAPAVGATLTLGAAGTEAFRSYYLQPGSQSLHPYYLRFGTEVTFQLTPLLFSAVYLAKSAISTDSISQRKAYFTEGTSNSSAAAKTKNFAKVLFGSDSLKLRALNLLKSISCAAMFVLVAKSLYHATNQKLCESYHRYDPILQCGEDYECPKMLQPLCNIAANYILPDYNCELYTDELSKLPFNASVTDKILHCKSWGSDAYPRIHDA